MSNEDRLTDGGAPKDNDAAPLVPAQAKDPSAIRAEPANRDSPWKQLYANLLSEHEQLRKEVERLRADCEQYRSSLLYYMRKYDPRPEECDMTFEEIMAQCSQSKQTIEELIAELEEENLGHPVPNFVRTAREVIEQRNATELSDRDRDVFLAMLDETDAKPNTALRTAAAR